MLNKSPIDLLLKKKIIFKSAVNGNTIARFTSDLSTLINAAVPLVKSLEVLATKQTNKVFGNVVKGLAASVHSGVAFSISLMRYSKIFDPLFISMVKAGEASSSLGEVLERIARHKDKEAKLRKKTKAIMTYPIIVITIAVTIISLLFLFVIPKFESVFSTVLHESNLPFVTRIIIFISQSFQGICITSGMVFGFLFLIIKLLKKRVKDKILFKMPIIGNLIRDINMSLFSRMLGILITNGVPLIEAMEIIRNTTNNEFIKESISNTYMLISNGETLSNALKSERNFPEMAISMINVGEETGTLPKMLLEIANKFEDDIEIRLEALISILEPLMTVLLAVVIGSIVIALFLPIINIMNSVVSF